MSKLQGWRDNVTMYTRLAEATEKAIAYTPMGTFDEDGFLIKFPPSPPLQPNAATIEMLHEEYKEQIIINQALVDLTVEQYSECFVADRSDETICGLSRNEVPSAHNQLLRSVYTPLAPLCSMQAPNPWIATDGTPCRGYATLQAREEDYCGCARATRCTALRPTHPPPTHPPPFLSVLLRRLGLGRQPVGGPLQAAGGAAQARAVLHQRRQPGVVLLAERLAHAALGGNRRRVHASAGPALLVFRIESNHIHAHIHRPVIRLRNCGPLFPLSLLMHVSLFVGSEFKFARDRLTPESGLDIEKCRANLTSRVEKCHLRCDTCKAECTSSAARSLVGTYKCGIALPTLGMALAMKTSDIGEEIGRRWGAKRVYGREAAPDASYEEEYRTVVQNSIDRPRAPRNGLVALFNLEHARTQLTFLCALPGSNFVPQGPHRVGHRRLRAHARPSRPPHPAQRLHGRVQARPRLHEPLRQCALLFQTNLPFRTFRVVR